MSRAIQYIQRSNLTFDDDHLVVAATVENQKISATVDTGAMMTYLYKPFAEKFEAAEGIGPERLDRCARGWAC